MRRLIAAGTAGLVLLFMGYAASGIGNASTDRAADSTSSSIGSSSSSSTSTSTSSISTSTSISTTTTTTPAPRKVTICHRTKSKKHPYLRIRVSGSALKAHMHHKGDIIPAPGGVCPRHVVLVRNHHIVIKKKHGR